MLVVNTFSVIFISQVFRYVRLLLQLRLRRIDLPPCHLQIKELSTMNLARRSYRRTIIGWTDQPDYAE